MTTTRYAPASRSVHHTARAGWHYLAMCRAYDRAMAELADDGSVEGHFHINRHDHQEVQK